MMEEEKKNLKQIDDETLSHLDDDQLQEIAGGAREDGPDEEDETCGVGSCNVIIVKTK